MKLTNYLGFTEKDWIELLEECGAKRFHASQIMKWIHHRFIKDFSEMSDIGKEFRDYLVEKGTLLEPKVRAEFVSKDGTRKWLIQSFSGSLFELVYIPEQDRGTLCVSSQVGCVLDCDFCSTGKQGFSNNLTSAEIVGQIRIAIRKLSEIYPRRKRNVTNVVFMGMGEPLLNLDNILPALDLIRSDLGYGISKRKVTVSTAGIVPAIKSLAENADVSLAVSLHAPNDELRDQLMPVNKKYPLADLLEACREYAKKFSDKRPIFVEYTLLKGINDNFDNAKELCSILRDLPCKINLIPFNSFPGSAFKQPSSRRVREFQSILVEKGYSVTVRTTRGSDIQAACGQLVGRVSDRTNRQAKYGEISLVNEKYFK
ncbi:MAG: 23S rRNA (adenine(2503)-C(2))-methyltransferase RlmN [Gammaproteobacteria bacterium]|nr:23S rRNA (adenine(2503)-C(2))-methyltransferase RlmN [Gammaproteobacteria bacterium]